MNAALLLLKHVEKWLVMGQCQSHKQLREEVVGVRTENYTIACTTSESRMHNKCIQQEIHDPGRYDPG